MSNKSNIYSHNTSGKNPVPQLSHKHGQPVEKHLVLLWLAKSLSLGLCSGSSFPTLGGTRSSFTPSVLAPPSPCCPHTMECVQELHHTKPGVMSTALEKLVCGPHGRSRWRVNGKHSPRAESLAPYLPRCSLASRSLPGVLHYVPHLFSTVSVNMLHQTSQTPKTSVSFKQNDPKCSPCNSLGNQGWIFLHRPRRWWERAASLRPVRGQEPQGCKRVTEGSI